MVYIQLQTGNTISMSCYEYYFVLKDEDMDRFYQDCIADDLGIEINNPWAGRASMGEIESIEEVTDFIPEDPEI